MDKEKCDECGTVLNIHGCLSCGAPVCCPKCCNQDSIVYRLAHPATEDMTILLRDAATAIIELTRIAAEHREGRLDALERLAKHQGQALDADVWDVPNAALRGDSGLIAGVPLESIVRGENPGKD